MPPSSEPNAIGISMAEGGVPLRRAGWKATGIIIASAPIFFTKPDKAATTAVRTKIWMVGVVSHGAMGRNAASILPERSTAALTISALATMMMSSQEAGERLVVWNDAGEQAGQQRQHRHHVRSEAFPGQTNPSSRRGSREARIYGVVTEAAAAECRE